MGKEEGACSESQLHWYYERSDRVCKQFIYCGCERRCSRSQDNCILPRVVRPCSGSFRQWFYDSSTDNCYEFDYGGCQDNPNRFNNATECQQRFQRQRFQPNKRPTPTEPPYSRVLEEEYKREREKQEFECGREPEKEGARQLDRDQPSSGGGEEFYKSMYQHRMCKLDKRIRNIGIAFSSFHISTAILYFFFLLTN